MLTLGAAAKEGEANAAMIARDKITIMNRRWLSRICASANELSSFDRTGPIGAAKLFSRNAGQELKRWDFLECGDAVAQRLAVIRKRRKKIFGVFSGYGINYTMEEYH